MSSDQAVQAAFTSHDGIELRYRHWPASQPAKRALLLFHRGHEHSGRWQETVEALRLDGFPIFAWDQRGPGKSSGDRGAAENLGVIVKDADLFARHVCDAHNIEMENVIV